MKKDLHFSLLFLSLTPLPLPPLVLKIIKNIFIRLAKIAIALVIVPDGVQLAFEADLHPITNAVSSPPPLSSRLSLSHKIISCSIYIQWEMGDIRKKRVEYNFDYTHKYFFYETLGIASGDPEY